ncbi:TetR/AcrR family transcriptional regulator [Chondrinema litorale]|uniref:TetR/AcrR family transcriptional regulator n=1 Tax=Chondrinema litorale TaxID=2994555 RepID=UPI0025433F5E|nr:helix-turn-helix domain-containing protein [Chondrinema litorale]UZR98523.1 helix-turn-helix domain containing protein [Chondrinema litorale]
MKYIRIVHIAIILFSKQGIKATSMDDIANHCGISKKTLYLQFRSKEALVDAVLLLIKNHFELTIANQSIYSNSLVEELFSFLNYLSKAPSILTPVFLIDLKSTYNAQYCKFFHFFYSKITFFINNNIEIGIKKGYYVKSILVNQIANWYFWQIKHAFVEQISSQQDSFKKISFTNQILIEIFIH